MRENGLDKLTAALSDLCVAMARVQAAASQLLDDLLEALLGAAEAPAGTACYDPGPPRLLGLVLPEAPPRLDVHWGSAPGISSYAEVRERWRRLVGKTLESARGALPLDRPFERAAAFFTFYSGGRAVGVENYTVRFVLNALREGGVLVDDTFDRLVITVRALAGLPLRTEVVLVEDMDLPFRGLEAVEPYRRIVEEIEGRRRPQELDELI